MKNKLKPRILSLIAVLTIGEGIVLILFSNKYLKTWLIGPRFFRIFITFFINNPCFIRTIGVVESVFGLWIGSKIRAR